MTDDELDFAQHDLAIKALGAAISRAAMFAVTEGHTREVFMGMMERSAGQAFDIQMRNAQHPKLSRHEFGLKLRKA